MANSWRITAVLGAVAASVLTVSTSTASAQGADMLGERVRVQLSNGDQSEGTVVLWGADSLGLRATQDVAPEVLGWTRVREVARYKSNRRTGTGLLLGSVLGGLTGALAGRALPDGCPGDSFCVGPHSEAEKATVGAVIGVVAGAVVGGVIGHSIGRPSWEPVVIPSASAGAEVSLRFHAH